MTVTHVFYSGLGGHTSVFWSMFQQADQDYKFKVCLFGIEKPMIETTERCNDNGIEFSFSLKKGRLDVLHRLRLAKAVFSSKPDVVFLHGSYGILTIYFACKIFGAKLVVRETQAMNLKTKMEQIASNLSLILSKRMIFLSLDYSKSFLKGWRKLFSNKTIVIPNGLDLDFFSPQQNMGHRARIEIGMISRLVPIKDHFTLIESISILRDKGYSNILLRIAGEGTTEKSLKDQVKAKNLEKYVQFDGLLSQKQSAEFLKSLDIYVHSSYGETMSNSVMQAQACALPIVATNVFGINNVIQDQKNGFLFELGDSKRLVKILEDLIVDESLRLKYGGVSRQYALDNLSNKVMAGKYLDIFKSICKN